MNDLIVKFYIVNENTRRIFYNLDEINDQFLRFRNVPSIRFMSRVFDFPCDLEGRFQSSYHILW